MRLKDLAIAFVILFTILNSVGILYILLEEQIIGYSPIENIALNKPIVQERGQIDYKDYATIYSSKNVTDGDVNTGWRTSTDDSLNTMGVIDLQGEYSINKISFIVNSDTKPQFDREIAFKIDYSKLDKVNMLDDNDWTELGRKSIPVEDMVNTHEISFPKVNARFIRIQYLYEDQEWGGWGNVQEVMVYGKKR